MSGWSHLKARGQAEPPLLPSLRVDLGGAVDEASLRELVGCSSRAAFAHVRSSHPPGRVFLILRSVDPRPPPRRPRAPCAKNKTNVGYVSVTRAAGENFEGWRPEMSIFL